MPTPRWHAAVLCGPAPLFALLQWMLFPLALHAQVVLKQHMRGLSSERLSTYWVIVLARNFAISCLEAIIVML